MWKKSIWFWLLLLPGGALAETVASDEGACRLVPSDAFNQLDLIFGTQGRALPAGTANAQDAADALRVFVRDRLEADSFFQTVIPKVVPAAAARKGFPVLPLTLKNEKSGGRAFYYLDHPCKRADQVKVHPWWDIESTVYICKDAYRLELVNDERLGIVQHCEYSFWPSKIPNERICRCGEYLLSCARDDAQQTALKKAWKDEAVLTIQYVVQNHQPFSRIMTMNETVRNDFGELFYARNRFYQTGHFDLIRPDPASRSSLRPREPYFGGGVLSTPQFVWDGDSHRGQIATLQDDLLGLSIPSASVSASVILKLKDVRRLRTGTHMDLAAAPGCGHCHARLENSVLALQPFTQVREGQRFIPQNIYPGNIKFFLSNATDFRGEGPATLQWLGETMAKQPEFAATMGRRILELIFQGAPVPVATKTRLIQSFQQDMNFGGLVEQTAVAKYCVHSTMGLSAAGEGRP